MAPQGQGFNQIADQCSHSPHYLLIGRASEAYLIKRQGQEILPGGLRDGQSESPLPYHG